MGFIKPNNNSGGSGGGLTPQELSRLNDAYSHSKSEHAPTTAEENVQADWNETDETSDAYIKNKPTISNDGFNTISSTPILTLDSTTIRNSWDSSRKYFAIIDLPLLNLSYDKRYVIDFLGKKQVCGLAEGKNLACNFETVYVSIEKYQSSQTEYATAVLIQTPTDAEGNLADISNMDLTDLVLYEEEVTIIDSKYLDSDLKFINSIGLGRVGTVGSNSCAIGYVVEASGKYSHAEGAQNHSLGQCSHTEGARNIAYGNNSHAEGAFTKAKGNYSHAEGYGTEANAYYSHAEGYITKVNGNYSHVEGCGTIASSQYQHVQGKYNIEDTENKYAHIVGNGTSDTKLSNAHTLDWNGNAWYKGKLSQDGTPTEDKDLTTKKYVDDAISNVSISGGSGDGFNTISSNLILSLTASEIQNSIDSGTEITLSSLDGIFDENKRYIVEFLGERKLSSIYPTNNNEVIHWNIACNFRDSLVDLYYSTSDNVMKLGIVKKNTDTVVTATDLKVYEEIVTPFDDKYLPIDLTLQNSISIGRIGDIGIYSLAMGFKTEASGNYSFAQGSRTKATGGYSFASGRESEASGSYSIATGMYTVAKGAYSHAEGFQSKANETSSHAEGVMTQASATGAHSEGGNTVAKGYFSHVEGYSTKASGEYQHVQGKYNIEDTENKYAHIVGNGTSDTKRSNAHTLDWNGNAWYKGTISCDGTPTNDNDLITKAYFEANKGEGGSVDLSSYAPIDSPDFTGDISMRRKSGTTVGLYSISLGDENEASGACSCAMGYGCVSSKTTSFAFGNRVRALSDYQCVLGAFNELDSEKKYIHIIGNGKLDYDGKEVRSNAYTLDWEGNGWFKGNVSIDGTPTADNHLINKKYVDDAILQATTGGQIDLSGYAKSDNPVFTGALSMYRKSGTTVGQYSVALGSNATASGKKSVAIGDNVTASGSASFACGAMCTASGSLSHAEGFFCTAGADSSHAEGCLTQALGQQSHSEGNNTIANCNFQHVQGTFNIKDEDGIYAHIIGNGTDDNARANIHTVAWDGKGWFKGDVYVGGTSQADGKKLLSTADIYFDTDGNLCVTIGGVTKKFAPIG